MHRHYNLAVTSQQTIPEHKRVVIQPNASEGVGVETYKRQILQAAVGHRECVSGPGFWDDKEGDSVPLITALHISYKYRWSVLKSTNTASSMSGNVFEYMGTYSVIFLAWHWASAFPMGPENVHGPSVVSSKWYIRWRKGNSLACNKQMNHWTLHCFSYSIRVTTPPTLPVFTTVPSQPTATIFDKLTSFSSKWSIMALQIIREQPNWGDTCPRCRSRYQCISAANATAYLFSYQCLSAVKTKWSGVGNFEGPSSDAARGCRCVVHPLPRPIGAMLVVSHSIIQVLKG